MQEAQNAEKAQAIGVFGLVVLAGLVFFSMSASATDFSFCANLTDFLGDPAGFDMNVTAQGDNGSESGTGLICMNLSADSISSIVVDMDSGAYDSNLSELVVRPEVSLDSTTVVQVRLTDASTGSPLEGTFCQIWAEGPVGTPVAVISRACGYDAYGNHINCSGYLSSDSSGLFLATYSFPSTIFLYGRNYTLFADCDGKSINNSIRMWLPYKQDYRYYTDQAKHQPGWIIVIIIAGVILTIFSKWALKKVWRSARR